MYQIFKFLEIKQIRFAMKDLLNATEKQSFVNLFKIILNNKK